MKLATARKLCTKHGTLTNLGADVGYFRLEVGPDAMVSFCYEGDDESLIYGIVARKRRLGGKYEPLEARTLAQAICYAKSRVHALRRNKDVLLVEENYSGQAVRRELTARVLLASASYPGSEVVSSNPEWGRMLDHAIECKQAGPALDWLDENMVADRAGIILV